MKTLMEIEEEGGILTSHWELVEAIDDVMAVCSKNLGPTGQHEEALIKIQNILLDIIGTDDEDDDDEDENRD